MSAILESADIDRALKRISHEIIERNHGVSSVVLLGIPTRGAYLAARIASILKDLGSEVPLGTVDITMHRDDLRLRPPDCVLGDRERRPGRRVAGIHWGRRHHRHRHR